MISPDLLQEAFVSKLKADPSIAAFYAALDGSPIPDIRERDYKGPDIIYPNIRVGLNMLMPKGSGTCREIISVFTCAVTAHSERASSLEASVLTGLVVGALFGRQLTGVGWCVRTINANGLRAPTQAAPDHWRGDVYLHGNVYQTN